MILAHAISTIVDAKGKILLDDLKPDPISNSVRQAISKLKVGGMEGDPEIDPDWGEPGLTPAERVFAWNTFEVLAFESGNPAKVVNLERDLYNLRFELAQLTGVTVDTADGISKETSAYDGGGGGEEAAAIRQKIDKKENDLTIERRSVFRGWLKNIFLGQAVLSLALSLVMATTPETLFGQFEWFQYYNMDVSIKVLGYWWWWLFIVPSLRSRRPKGFEKKAFKYYLKGAEQGDLIGNYWVGCLYWEGKGTTKDVPKAIEHLKVASELGNCQADY